MQLAKPANVVNVRVRADDGLHRKLVPAQQVQNAANLIARIDDERFPRNRIADYRAIALQHPHRYGDVQKSLLLNTHSRTQLIHPLIHPRSITIFATTFLSPFANPSLNPKAADFAFCRLATCTSTVPPTSCPGVPPVLSSAVNIAYHGPESSFCGAATCPFQIFCSCGLPPIAGHNSPRATPFRVNTCESASK